MAELKTKPTKASVTAFIKAVDDPGKRRDMRKVGAMMRRATRSRARMWGPGIVGYGVYEYDRGEWMLTGYSPRKHALTVYIMSGFAHFEPLMKKLGTYKTGKSCLYIKRLADVDEAVLEELIKRSVAAMRRNYRTRTS